ncbi:MULTISPECIES: helix-turn-helix domain-containing protein [Burkholderiaceae]|uniref:helix-turn-helix domain-containing protein n=1 Tax=Burkholderiaceae TaxID=119060 RepID=UPI0009639AE3|nr:MULTISPECIES: helix-turn-helix domain-containing protein [Burkholderiaceae]MCG1017267.1 helix-turn-helix domain-containing protein [Mycetohabitans sp. B4]SIT70892.1 HTH-type transcriptional regulator / antitoxin HipB [Burkholderia sp. b13]
MSHTPPFQLLVTALQLGQLLKAARKRSKLTQAEVAARLGLSQNRVSYLEQHPDQLSFKQLLGWCAAVGLELRLGERERERLESTNKTQW